MNITILTNIQNEYSPYLHVILTIIFILILIIGLFGNTLVLLSVMSNHLKIRRSSTNLLLVNMSCADLIILIFNIFDIVQFILDSFWPTAWYLGLSLCKIVRFGQVLGCYVSVQTLLVISIERYISIVSPIKISQMNRRKRLYIVFIFIWSLGFFSALPNLYLLKLHPFYNRPTYYICGLSDHRTHSHLITFYKYIESILFFFLPAFIQTILYIIICHKIFLVDRVVQADCHARQLQESIRSDTLQQCSDSKLSSSFPSPLNVTASTMISPRSRTHVSSSTTNHGNKTRKKAVIMLVFIAIFYFIAFSPAQINFIYTQITHSHHLYEYRLFFIVTILLALSSTAFNPILFYIFTKFFQHKFNILLRRMCTSCRSSSSTRRQNNIPMI
ncbi:unnamed protein product [Adineta steineri]|uniref:G-protein coupled receptors family 1 profile domain-containing protein n=1 Tax=Adineta steineri TaxID=433720 RepID=A0A814SJS1_9BILA|nr:unnamed protein product [Adineta steineri]CAF1130362.1 unnamed protein product [Adineta steineri]CAF1147403.1 unnamed protein product [Adineta steineri]CAF3637845.1 unnamed protein product [Adineta steineri]CAF3884423.1 unnamed protein product [Adineta steineri]